jgi:AraC-like DNA-binding protein
VEVFWLCEYVCLKCELAESEQRHNNFMQRVNKWKLNERSRAGLKELEEQRQRHNEFLRAEMQRIEAQAEKFEGLARQIYYYKNIKGWTIEDISRLLNYSNSQVNRIYKKAVG